MLPHTGRLSIISMAKFSEHGEIRYRISLLAMHYVNKEYSCEDKVPSTIYC